MKQTDFMWETDVGDHGAGRVERNTVVSTMILLRVRNCRQQKTRMMHLVVERKTGLQKKNTVLEVTQDIVRRAGELRFALNAIYLNQAFYDLRVLFVSNQDGL